MRNVWCRSDFLKESKFAPGPYPYGCEGPIRLGEFLEVCYKCVIHHTPCGSYFGKQIKMWAHTGIKKVGNCKNPFLDYPGTVLGQIVLIAEDGVVPHWQIHYGGIL